MMMILDPDTDQGVTPGGFPWHVLPYDPDELYCLKGSALIAPPDSACVSLCRFTSEGALAAFWRYKVAQGSYGGPYPGAKRTDLRESIRVARKRGLPRVTIVAEGLEVVAEVEVEVAP
jgi:hypothetical protein